MAAHRAEQILDHMDELYRAGNQGVKPDTYTYNTLINAHAKSSEKGSAARAEHVLQVMKQRYLDGDGDFKPNTRTHTSVIDAWAKSGEKGAAKRAEQILHSMITTFEGSGDYDSKPNVHTANAVCNVSLRGSSDFVVFDTIVIHKAHLFSDWYIFLILGLCFYQKGRRSR